jgi:hypothetical protein
MPALLLQRFCAEDALRDEMGANAKLQKNTHSKYDLEDFVQSAGTGGGWNTPGSEFCPALEKRQFETSWTCKRRDTEVLYIFKLIWRCRLLPKLSRPATVRGPDSALPPAAAVMFGGCNAGREWSVRNFRVTFVSRQKVVQSCAAAPQYQACLKTIRWWLLGSK